MAITWKDQSSHSRGDQRRIPNIWVANINKLKIAVVYNHIDYPGRWIVNCRPFFDNEILTNINMEDARDEAIIKIRGCLEKILKGLR